MCRTTSAIPAMLLLFIYESWERIMTAVLRLTKHEAAKREWTCLQHFLLAAYASTENHTQRIVVVDPTIVEPTWVVKPRARAATHRTVLALMLPSLDALTTDMSSQHTGIRATYFGLREWPREDRWRGVHRPDTYPLVQQQ